jgi:hypothetical protein
MVGIFDPEKLRLIHPTMGLPQIFQLELRFFSCLTLTSLHAVLLRILIYHVHFGGKAAGTNVAGIIHPARKTNSHVRTSTC